MCGLLFEYDVRLSVKLYFTKSYMNIRTKKHTEADFSASVCFLCRMRTCEGLRVKKSSLKKIRSHMRADFAWCFSIFIMYDAFLFYNKDTDTHLYRDGYFRAGTETRPYRVVQTSSFLILPSSPLRDPLLPLRRRSESVRCSRNARRRAHGHSHRRHSRNVP